MHKHRVTNADPYGQTDRRTHTYIRPSSTQPHIYTYDHPSHTHPRAIAELLQLRQVFRPPLQAAACLPGTGRSRRGPVPARTPAPPPCPAACASARSHVAPQCMARVQSDGVPSPARPPAPDPTAHHADEECTHLRRRPRPRQSPLTVSPQACRGPKDVRYSSHGRHEELAQGTNMIVVCDGSLLSLTSVNFRS